MGGELIDAGRDEYGRVLGVWLCSTGEEWTWKPVGNIDEVGVGLWWVVWGQVLSCDDIKFRGPYSLFIERIIMQNEGRCDDIMDGRSD